MLFTKIGLLSALFSTFITLSTGAPANIEDRENACIALDDCPGDDPPAATPSSITSPPVTTPTSSPTFGCFHAADPDGAEGYCPAVAATGWCVCSDSSTYAIETGDNPCGYTAPPASGPTTIPSTNCATTTSSAPVATASISLRNKCSPAQCPKFCDLGNSDDTKRSIPESDFTFPLDKRFYENANPNQFPYQLLSQSYTTNVCPSQPRNTYIWRNLATQRSAYAAALQGLSGCTTIFVASPKGVFSSHIWELSEVDPPRDLQAANYVATLQDLQTALSAHKDDLADGGEAFLIIPTDPDQQQPPAGNPNNYLYGTQIVDAIVQAINDATGGLQARITTYSPLDFETSTELGTSKRGTASFQFDPNYTDGGTTSRAYRVVIEGNLVSQKTGL